MVNLNKLVLTMLVSVSSIIAQDIGTTEIKVVEGFAPSIPDAVRLNENAVFADTIKKDRKQVYDVIDFSLKSDYKTRSLEAAKVKGDRISELYARRIELGIGNSLTTKVHAMYSSKRSKTLSYGLIADHFANQYLFAKNSKNRMMLYGKQIRSSYIFLTSFEYDRRTALYYDEANNLEEIKFFRNRFAYTKFLLTAISKEDSPQNLKHQTTFFISDMNEFSENQIHLSSTINQRINNFPIALHLKFDDYFNYNNPDSRFREEDVKLFTFSPSVLIKRYDINFDVGVDFDFVSETSRFQFFPEIKITKEIVKDVILINAGLRHIKDRYTLKSLSDENIYIHSFGMNQSIFGEQEIYQHYQQLKFSDRNELYFSVRNVLSEEEVLEGGLSYANVQNFAHFIQIRTPVYNRFKVDYLNVKELNFKIDYSNKVNNILSVKINLDYYNWDKEVYYKPNFICSISAPLTLRNKIKVSSALVYFSKRNSVQYSFDDLPTPYNDTINELSSQFLANLGFYYFYSKQLSISLELNNLTNTKEDLWDGYSQVGFNGVLGVHYCF